MLVAHYIGPAKKGLLAKIGWNLTVIGQKSPFDRCTHTEAIHSVNDDGTFTIASSSIQDKGVRVKERVQLTPSNWVITDVPIWNVEDSVRWFSSAIDRGVEYDKRGALATLLPGKEDSSKVFCTEAVLIPFVQAPHYFSPALSLALCLSIGNDVTDRFLPV